MSYEPWGSTLPVTANAGATDAVVAGIGLDRFAVAWEDTAGTEGDASGTAIRLKVFDPFGVALNTTPIVVNTTTTGNQANPQVLGLAGGDFVVVWEDNSGSGGDASGTALKGQRFTANGEKLGVEFLVNTGTAGNQAKAALARDGTGFVVAWVDSGGANDDIRFQRFDANGVRVGAETTVGASVAGHQSQVEAADTSAGFAIAWSDDADGNGTIDAIRVQAYTSAGAPAAAERSFTTGEQGIVGLLDLARTDSTGGLAVLYADQFAAQPAPRNLVRILDGTGAPAAGPFDAGWSLSGYFVQGVQLAGWQGVTVEEGALARGDNDGILNRGGLFVAALRNDGLAEGTTVFQTTGGAAPTVLDSSMLQDGRIVTVMQQPGGITFAIADGRGPQVAASFGSGPAVLVGADVGPDANNVLVGALSADRLYGLGGNDYLYGGFGSDMLVAGRGSDVLLGQEGNDTLFGEDGDDYLYGHAGTNVFVGGAGVDVLISQGSDDTLYGGEGGDYLYAYGSTATLAFGEAGNDIFVMQSGPGSAHGGEGQDYFYMGAFADLMAGGAGVDVLQGGGGQDTYDGGAGTDYLFLHSGRDAVIVNLQSGVDVVNDFDPANDLLRLQGTGFTSLAQVQAATTQYDGFIVVTVDANTAVWLMGVTAGQLDASNVLFA